MISRTLEQQVSQLVETLKKSNLEQEKKGARKIPDTEYEQLKSVLLKKVIRK